MNLRLWVMVFATLLVEAEILLQKGAGRGR
jgi:hypothetical protein